MGLATRHQRTLWGWYAYAFSAEPFVVSAVATYVPLLLEQLARDNAVRVEDHRTPCVQSPSDSPGMVPLPITPPNCVVRLGWTWIDTSSLPLYTFSLAVVAQLVLVITVSGLADRTKHKTRYLVGFAIVGSLVTLILASIQRAHYYVAALLSVVGIACFGAVSVIGNAYLPSIAAAETHRLARKQLTTIDDTYVASRSDSNAGHSARMRLIEVDGASVAAWISGKGVAVGYGAAFVVQVASMIWLAYSGEDALQWVIGAVGMWWLVGQIPVALWLRDPRPAPVESEIWVQSSWLDGWKELGRALRGIRELQDIATFLVGWFLLSDAVTTINSTAVLFARANLQMATPALALVGLVTVVFAIAGSLASSQILKTQRKDKMNPSPLVAIALLGAAIPFYGAIGFFTPWLGLRRAWEMYLLAAWYGLVLGALNAVCRSMYAMLIPRGHETMFFALYAVTDKGSSVIGPLVTGLMTDHTHNIRYAFYFLLLVMLLSAVVFARVDFQRGERDAQEQHALLHDTAL